MGKVNILSDLCHTVSRSMLPHVDGPVLNMDTQMHLLSALNITTGEDFGVFTIENEIACIFPVFRLHTCQGK